MRLDKCYRSWKTDLEIGFSPLDASLDRFVDFTKDNFVGRDALEGVSAETVNFMLRWARGLVCMPCDGMWLDKLDIGPMVPGHVVPSFSQVAPWSLLASMPSAHSQ